MKLAAGASGISTHTSKRSNLKKTLLKDSSGSENNLWIIGYRSMLYFNDM